MSEKSSKIVASTKSAKKRLNRKVKKEAKKVAQKTVKTEIREYKPLEDKLKRQIAFHAPRYSLAKLVAQHLALPHELTTLRVSNGYTQMPTAVANPYFRNDYTIPTVDGTSIGGLNTNSQLLVAMRCAERAIIIWDFNNGGKKYSYDLYGPGRKLTVPSKNLEMFDEDGQMPSEFVYLPATFGLPGTDAQFNPHGSCLFAGSDGDSEGRYFWLQEGSVLQIRTVSSDITVSGESNVKVDMWTANGVIQDYGHVTTVGGVVSISLDISGYIAIRVKPPGYTVTGANPSFCYTANISDTKGVFSHYAQTDYYKNIGSISGVRIPAVSILFTDMAAPLSLQGRIAGVQAAEGEFWTDYINGGAPLTKVASQKLHWDDRAATGIYGILKMTKPSDVDFKSYVKVLNGNLYDSFYPLKSDSAFLVVALEISNAAGKDGRFLVTHSMEYQTEDLFREVANSDIPRKIYDEASQILAKVDQWHCNPSHFKELYDSIVRGARSGLNFLKKNGPGALNFVSDTLPKVLTGVNTLKHLI
jgi:hypothetical protein